MKTIGLIGGMSWESTVTYYQVINETIRKELGGLHSAKVIINSVDFAPIAEAQERDDWDSCAGEMLKAAQSLERAGADLILIGANTMHICAPYVQEHCSVPLLHIADATIERLKRDHINTVALLGTRYTMCMDFYKERIIKSGISVLIPEKDIDTVNNIIYDELCQGILSGQSKQKLLDIISALKEKGAQGVILGCTELGLLVAQSDTDLPVYDTTLIHGEEAVLEALKSDSE